MLSSITGACYDELAGDRQKNLGINPDLQGVNAPWPFKA